MARMASARFKRWAAAWRATGWRVLCAAVAVAALAPLAPACAETAPSDAQFFRIGTGGADSPSFAVAGLVAAGLSSPPGARPCERGGSCGVPGLIALAQALGSPAEAIDLLEQRQIDAIVVPGGEAYRAYAAKRPDTAKPREALRTVATLYVEVVHAVVREGSRYETIDDLRRRSVAGATADPASAPFLQLYASQLGLATAKAPVPTLPVQAALQRLADSRLDGLLIVATPPLPALVEFANLVAIRLLAAPPAASTRLPYLADVRLAAGSYAGAEALDLPALPTQLVVPASADPARIEAITRALWHDATQKLLAGGSPVARTVKLERALAGIVVPLHPGAARFYREAGLLGATPVGD